MLLHHAEVVGDEEIGQPQVLLQVLEQVDDLGPDRHVERRDRLVRYHEAGVERQGPGDHHPLPLAAGEGVRVAVGGIARQADQAQQVDHLVARLLPAPDQPVHDQRFRDDVEDAHPRVQAGVGVLEDQLHVAAQLAQVLAGDVGDVPALEPDPAAADRHPAQHRRPVVVLPDPSPRPGRASRRA